MHSCSFWHCKRKNYSNNNVPMALSVLSQKVSDLMAVLTCFLGHGDISKPLKLWTVQTVPWEGNSWCALHSYGQNLSLFHYSWKKNWSPLTGAPKGTSMELQRKQQHHFWLCDKRFSLESTHLTLSPRNNGPIIRVMAAAFQVLILQKQNLNPTNLFTAGSAGIDKILTFPPFSILGFFKHNIL